jgi:dCTP deaminase
MTILCDRDLMALMRDGLIEDPDYALINPASIDIRVGHNVILEDDSDKLANSGMNRKQTLPSDGMYVWPGQLVLVDTFETFNVPNGYAMDLRLKSSTARRGWNHSLAFWADPGFRGKLTMEINNSLKRGPLMLVPGQRFAQIIVHKLSGLSASPYAGRYQDATTVEAAKDG